MITARGAIPSVIGYHNVYQQGLQTQHHTSVFVLLLANAMILHWQGLSWLNMALCGMDAFKFSNFCLLHLFQPWPFEHGVLQRDGLWSDALWLYQMFGHSTAKTCSVAVACHMLECGKKICQFKCICQICQQMSDMSQMSGGHLPDDIH